VSAGWRCSSCGGDNPPATRFCGHCGAPEAIPISVISPEPRELKRDDVEQALRNFVHHQVADRLIEAGGRLGEERRLVTALFADISGFTPMADRLDPEQLMEVIDPIIRRLSSVVDRYEGYIDKFAGDALLAFFGAPVSHEDDAIRALLVALEMHREIDAMVGQLGPEAGELTLHVGVNTGHVIARVLGSDVRLDYSVLGDAVILAQRLESAAPGGGTYVGETTYRLAAHRFDFESVGELTLKGKAQPVPAWRLVGERASASPPPRAGLVGRMRELARVSEAIDALQAGRGSLVSILGEPGIGKSRLVQTVEEQAGQRKLRWLDARCLSYGAALPYWPYADLLRRMCGIARDMPAAQARARLADLLATTGGLNSEGFLQRLMGITANGADGELEPEALRRGLHAAVAELVTALARKGPLVFAMEDLHWADASSVDLTADLIRATTDSPILYLVTGRPEARSRTAALAGLRQEDVQREIVLEALDPTAVQTLVAELVGGTPDAALVDLLAERTGGNPFFVEETVRSLQEAEVLVERNARWTTAPAWQPESVPETIEGVIAARLDRLSPAEAATLELSSVIGRTVRRPLLEAVAHDLPQLDASIDRLAEGGFLDQRPNDPERSFSFHHALVQSVAYNRMLRKRRRELHLRVADAAEAIYGAADDFIDLLARHLYLAEAGDRAVDALLRAANRAQRLFANREAIVHLRNVLEITQLRAEVSAQPISVLLDLARLEDRVGNYDAAYGLYQQVREATNDLESWQGMAAVLRKLGRYDEALALIEQAFDHLAGQPLDLRPLWHERAWTLNVAGRFKEATAAADIGLALRAEDDPPAGYLLLQRARAATVEERYQDAINDGRNAERIFEANEHWHGLATGLRGLGYAYTAAGQLEVAEPVLRKALQLAEQIGNAEDIGGALTNLGIVLAERGSIDEAIQCDRRAIEEFERIGHGSGRSTAYANLAEKLVSQGAFEEAMIYCDRALQLAEAIGNLFSVADARATRAAILTKTGSDGDAATEFAQAAELFQELGATQRAAAASSQAAAALGRSRSTL
jgi:class 3 adenylate cyclase/tetratricopeptide (TPR) repeat protein